MYDFKFADIGEGIHEGVILEWKYKVGDTIEEGETLVIIETDKVNAEIPSPVTGVITKLGPNEGKTVHVGETLAVINEGGEEVETATPEPIAEGEEANSAGVVGEIEVGNEVISTSEEHQPESNETTKTRVLATPVARKLAKDLDVDISTVKGSGPNGRVMKADIHAVKETMKSVPTTSKPVKVDVPVPTFNQERTHREKISKLRKTISENMTLSKTLIPHTTIMDEVIVSELVEFRSSQKEMAKEQGISLTYMPFIIKALSSTLKEFPIFNSSFDHINDEIIYKHYMNIGIAVDTKDGLIVPNIKDANTKSIFELANELTTLKEKAENKKITLDDLRDGTISITNYGVFDATFGAPVIKYPEVAIIGIGKIAKKPIVENDEIVIKHVLPLSFSIDHRVIDGGDAGRFLRTFKGYLKDPLFLLMN